MGRETISSRVWLDQVVLGKAGLIGCPVGGPKQREEKARGRELCVGIALGSFIPGLPGQMCLQLPLGLKGDCWLLMANDGH